MDAGTETRLIILSDIHANWPALEAVLAAEPAPDAIVFCGDMVDYGPQPVECLQWLAENADHIVRGNHDNALGFDADCRCTREFQEYSRTTRHWHRGLLNDGDYQFLCSLPIRHRFDWQGKQFRMAHATPRGDLFEYLDMDQWGSQVAGIDADFVLVGHTHIQGMRAFGKLTVVNPGSVGLARDYPGKACYAVYRDGEMDLKQIPYEVGRTVAALRSAPLPEHVIEGLAGVLGDDG
jgi:putative phosphoesterase